jgi:hypothetical protein
MVGTCNMHQGSKNVHTKLYHVLCYILYHIISCIGLD